MHDVFLILQWWFMLLILGAVFVQLTGAIFSSFFDRGYIFAKILGITILSYIIFILGFIHVLPFTRTTVILVLLALFLILNLTKVKIEKGKLLLAMRFLTERTFPWKIFFVEEILFLIGLFLWSFVRSFSPDINGLEKFMDFGFINSILRADYFPPKDMWLTPFAINYYYFGHLTTGVLIKLSGISSNISYNLMLATVFGLCFTASFSIGANLIYLLKQSILKPENKWKIILGGLLTAFLVTFSGNLHTIYTFFKPYENEKPVPFWQLTFSPSSFPNGYWYPNATRFIYNTIHEFPIYSWTVADLHGHVLDIPFVLLTIAVLLSLFQKYQINTKNKESRLFGIGNWKLEIGNLILISFLLAVMYMTNAWDGIIYFLLVGLVFFFIQWKRAQKDRSEHWIIDLFIGLFVYLFILGVGLLLFSLPFSINFKPFVSGIGILCAPKFLVAMKQLGPLLFEADHCQRSPLWQILILYGFFYFFVSSLLVFLFRFHFSHWSFIRNLSREARSRFAGKFGFRNLSDADIFVILLIILSTILIIIPEFIYVKDIYPAHYRANTMFKLVFQAFIMLSIVSGYISIRLVSNIKYQRSKIFNFYFVFFILAFVFLILVFIYPYRAIKSYYGDLKTFHSLDGTKYLKDSYPSDYEAIQWINKIIKGQPVILEAQGDSYTDYGRISANTGLPTVLGWTVHEWLWRGTYDVPSPRIEDVRKLYEDADGETLHALITKHSIKLVFIGDLERQKYANLNEVKWGALGSIVFQNGNTKIYQLN